MPNHTLKLLQYPKHLVLKTSGDNTIMWHFITGIILLLLMVSVSANSRIALVIGNSEYQQAYLNNPVNDALDIAKILSDYDFKVIGYNQKQQHLQTINLTQQAMENAVLEFKHALEKGSIGLFFYAGHAVQLNGQNYLIPVQAHITDKTLIKHRTINAQWVLEVMESQSTHLNVVVLDACRNNPFRSYFRTQRSGLAEMHTPSGTVMTYATHAGGLALDSDGLSNGLYTSHLLAAMEIEGLTIEQVFKRAARAVQIAAEQVGHRQEPWMSLSYTGKFCFTECLPDAQDLLQQIALLQAQQQPNATPPPQEDNVQPIQQPHNNRLQIAERHISPAQEATQQDESAAHSAILPPQNELPTVLQDNPVAENTVMASAPAITPVIFRDCAYCPELTHIPATNHFTIGSPDKEKGRDADEQQSTPIPISAFAIGIHEVTHAQYVAFLNAVKQRGAPEKPWFKTTAETATSKISGEAGSFQVKSGYEQHPIVHVSWYGATAYTTWLSQHTGKKYRLPTEAEWEYAARAGTTTQYWWGNEIGRNQANCYDGQCGDSFKYTAQIGAFSANTFGLYDTQGNVWEWTCSDYDSQYHGNEQHCAGDSDAKKVVRGGSWLNSPNSLRVANRSWANPANSNNSFGFRVVAAEEVEKVVVVTEKLQ